MGWPWSRLAEGTVWGPGSGALVDCGLPLSRTPGCLRGGLALLASEGGEPAGRRILGMAPVETSDSRMAGASGLALGVEWSPPYAWFPGSG